MTLPPYIKTKPYAHQEKAFLATADAEFAAIFWEQRTGKTKLILDTAAHQYHAGRIDSLLIIAPAAVHRNWVTEEIPTHLHESTNYRAVLWRSGAMQTKKAMAELAALLAHPGLAVLAVNVDALITETLKKYLVKFLKQRKSLGVVDESVDISAPNAARTKVALRVGARCVTRRIAEGTPVDAAPLGLYSQCGFLKPGLLGKSFLAFKQRYAEWEVKDVGERDRRCLDCGGLGTHNDIPCRRCRGTGYIGRTSFLALKQYKNIPELTELLGSFAHRVRRDQCVDLPPKIYEKRFFQLTKIQQRTYDDLRDEYMAELQTGDVLTVSMVLTRYMRLQQITSNFAPLEATLSLCPACQGEGCAECGEYGFTGSQRRVVEIDPNKDPRLQSLLEALDPMQGQGIIWARFTRDIETIHRHIPDSVRYDGTVTAEQRAVNLKAFQAGKVRYIVGNPRAGGRGLDLAGANHVVYYSHDWSLRWRRQSEDRAQSLKKHDSVLYIDIMAENTVDEKIIAALRDGKQISDLVLGDPSGPWI